MLQHDPMARLRLGPDESDELVDLRISAPGVPIDRLALCLGQNRVPITGKGDAGANGHQSQCGKRGLAKGAAVHGNPCQNCDRQRDRRRAPVLASCHTQT